MRFELPLLLDGGTGTNLIAAGMKAGERTADFILANPDVLERLQRDYVEAGTRVLFTPTFGINRIKYGDEAPALNRSLIALTKGVAAEYGGRVLVAGDQSPSGLFMEPMGNATFDEIYEVFAEQTRLFAEQGTDIVAAETMYSLAETRIALLAGLENSDRPVFVSLTVDKNGRTMQGDDAAAGVALLGAMGAAAAGINCSTGPQDMERTVARAAAAAVVPFFCKPNAGNDTDNYLSAADFAESMKTLAGHGAAMLGGCCGTTPAHIRALSQILGGSDGRSAERALCDRRAYLSRGDVTVVATARSLREFCGGVRLSPLSSVSGFLDDFYDFDPDEYDAAHIAPDSMADARALLGAAGMFDIPLCVSCGDGDILEKIAREYCGQLLISPDCTPSAALAQTLCAKYSAILL